MAKFLPLIRMLAADFTLKNFDANAIVHTVIHAIVAVLVVSCLINGGRKILDGQQSGDPKEKSDGITTLIWGLVIGGVIEAVAALVL